MEAATPKQREKKKEDNRNDLNEENFQCIILGTGLTDSIVGASLALHGKRTLFLDCSNCYGGTICNYNLEQYINYVQTQLDGTSKVKDFNSAFHSFRVIHPFDKNQH